MVTEEETGQREAVQGEELVPEPMRRMPSFYRWEQKHLEHTSREATGCIYHGRENRSFLIRLHW